MQNREYWQLIITMIVGGLTYSIISFSYMHSKFTTSDSFQLQSQRLDRIDQRIDKRLHNIEAKLDKLIQK